MSGSAARSGSRRGHVRAHHPRADVDDQHAAARDLRRERAREPGQTGLGGRVGDARVRGIVPDRGTTVDVDDVTTTPFEHRGQDGACAERGAAQVRLDHIPPVVGIGLDERDARSVDPRRAHEGVDGPERVADAGTRDRHVGRHGHVRARRKDAAPVAAELLDDCIQRVAVAIDQGQRATRTPGGHGRSPGRCRHPRPSRTRHRRRVAHRPRAQRRCRGACRVSCRGVVPDGSSRFRRLASRWPSAARP